MMKKIVKQLFMTVLALILFFVPEAMVNAAQTGEITQDEETEEIEDEETAEERERTPLTFDIAIFTYEILEEATQEDMPNGFTIGDWDYNGTAVKAGFTENSDMVCVMGQDWETGYKYRFIYDPNHDMFVPYFGTDIKDGYIYTIPMYEDAEVPYGFVDSYFVIQTVPMFTYMREDAELTQEEIAVGSLSEDNYLVFLMMDEKGKEVHYTYDLIDRTFQRALLQKKDAEKVTELNEVIDELHADIGKLNATNARRMNNRLTIIGVLIAASMIMLGIIVNLLLKISKLKNTWGFLSEEEENAEEDDAVEEDGTAEEVEEHEPEQGEAEEIVEEIEEEEEIEEDFEEKIEEEESPAPSGLKRFFSKKRKYDDYEAREENEVLETLNLDFPRESDDDIEILYLDEEDF